MILQKVEDWNPPQPAHGVGVAAASASAAEGSATSDSKSQTQANHDSDSDSGEDKRVVLLRTFFHCPTKVSKQVGTGTGGAPNVSSKPNAPPATIAQPTHPLIAVAADAAFDLVSSLYPYCLWSFPRHRHNRSWPCPRSPPRRV